MSPKKLSPEEQLKSLLMRVKGKNEKSWLKLTFKKLKSWHPVHFKTNRGGKSGSSDRFYIPGLQNHCGQ